MNLRNVAMVSAMALTGTVGNAAAQEHNVFVGAEVAYEESGTGVDGEAYAVTLGWDSRLTENWHLLLEASYAVPHASKELVRTVPGYRIEAATELDTRLRGLVGIQRDLGPRWSTTLSAGYEKFDVQASVIRTATGSCVTCGSVISDYSYTEEIPVAGLGVGFRWNRATQIGLRYLESLDGDSDRRELALVLQRRL
jgi:hypothetical protein